MTSRRRNLYFVGFLFAIGALPMRSQAPPRAATTSALDPTNAGSAARSSTANLVRDLTSYGAVADARVLYNGSIIKGSTRLALASATFTAADVGKVMLVEGAGLAGVRLSTTIQSYVDAHTVALAQSASTTTTDATIAYGTDNTIALQSAVDAAPNGAELSLPGAFLITATIFLNKNLKWRGAASGEGGGSAVVAGSRIIGSGFTLVRATESFVLEDLQITDPVGHISTIALDINDGKNGVANWDLRNVYITSKHTLKLGTGLRCIFGLKGLIQGGAIEGWEKGVDLQSISGEQSNANAFFGTKIRVNTIGIKMTDVGDLFLYGGTTEGNGIGIEHQSGVLFSAGHHFENNVAPRRNIHTTGSGTIVSVSDEFYASGADLDVFIESGAGRHSFTSPTFNAGLKHTGTGLVTIINPVNSVSVAGSGPITQISGAGIQRLQGVENTTFPFIGFSLLTTPSLTLNAGNDVSTTATIGGGGAAPTAPRSASVVLDAPHSSSFAGSANIKLRRNGSEIWSVGIDGVAPGGAKHTSTDYHWRNSTVGTYVAALNSTGDHTIIGDYIAGAVGKGLRIKEGSNAKMGSAVLVAGAAIVRTTQVTPKSRIFLTNNESAGTVGSLYVSRRIVGSSFTISSTSPMDASTISWVIVEPAP